MPLPAKRETTHLNTFSQRKVRTGILAGTSILTAVAILSTASPALANTAGTTTAASVVERATGTRDLAPSTATPDSAARAITSTESSSVTVTAPTDSLGRVEATAGDGTKLRLDLPETAKVAGVKAGAGTVVYADAVRSTDLAVQPTADGGARTLVTLKDDAARAPRPARSLPCGPAAATAGDAPQGRARTPGRSSSCPR
ncbi:hypothetical protein ABIE67_005729 [Streptomyces sp. V4I8]